MFGEQVGRSSHGGLHSRGVDAEKFLRWVDAGVKFLGGDNCRERGRVELDAQTGQEFLFRSVLLFRLEFVFLCLFELVREGVVSSRRIPLHHEERRNARWVSPALKIRRRLGSAETFVLERRLFLTHSMTRVVYVPKLQPAG